MSDLLHTLSGICRDALEHRLESDDPTVTEADVSEVQDLMVQIELAVETRSGILSTPSGMLRIITHDHHGGSTGWARCRTPR